MSHKSPPALFRIEYTGVVVPLLIAFGTFFVTVERYPLAYASFILAGLWGMAWVWILPRTQISRTASNFLRSAGSAFVVGATYVLCTTTYHYQLRLELESDSGVLIPAGDPMPDYTCYAPPYAFVVYWGKVASYRTGFYYPIVPSVTMGDAQILVLNFDRAAGTVAITGLQLFDDRGQILATITDNGIRLLNSAFRKRPDRSTLIIYDHLNREVLNIRYINNRAISIRGVFRYPGFPPVELNDQGIVINGAALQPSCILGELPGPRAPNAYGTETYSTPNGNIVIRF